MRYRSDAAGAGPAFRRHADHRPLHRKRDRRSSRCAESDAAAESGIVISRLRNGSLMAVLLDVIATPENFDDAGYLAANPDIADAYRKGLVRSPRQHFEKFGQREGRRLRLANSIADLRAEKIRKVEPLLRRDMPHVRRGVKYDFLTEALRTETGIVETNAVS